MIKNLKLGEVNELSGFVENIRNPKFRNYEVG